MASSTDGREAISCPGIPGTYPPPPPQAESGFLSPEPGPPCASWVSGRTWQKRFCLSAGSRVYKAKQLLSCGVRLSYWDPKSQCPEVAMPRGSQAALWKSRLGVSLCTPSRGPSPHQREPSAA
uniref:Uncharacterized protein n=1 Tax=Molossus molossus TaxID=27622 RepID=A0A7J8HHE5_MOLMO|nr:hypothetical protein HJG59_010939 [Molossus molossus]